MKMVFIDPYFNHTAGLFADKWFAPRLGTDVALGLAIAFTWLTEGTYDKEYVASHTVGFDEWKDYVLGESDGRPKTPEWAEGESGIPARGDPGPGPGVGRQEDHAGRRRQRRFRRRLSLCHRQRVGPHHDRSGRHAGPGQAGHQHMVDDAGRSLRHHVLVPRLQRGRHLRRPDHRERLSPGQPSVAQWGPSREPAALHRRPDGLSPPDPRGHDARAPRVAGQGLLRLVHRVAVPEVRVSRARVFARGHVLQVRRLLHRHHDRDQPLCEGLSRRQDPVRGQPVDLVRRRGQVRRHHPAGLHQLRALGHRRVGLSHRSRRLGGRRLQPPADSPSEEMHRTARASRSPTTRSSRSWPTAWVWVTSTPKGATPSSTGSSASSTRATCPAHLLGGVREEGLLPGAGPARPKADSCPALVRRGPDSATRRIWGPSRGTPWRSRVSRRPRARSSSWRPASSGSTPAAWSTRSVRPWARSTSPAGKDITPRSSWTSTRFSS